MRFLLIATLLERLLDKKSAIVRKLDKDILDNIEDEERITEEIDTAEVFHNFVNKNLIETETEQFFTRKEEEEEEASSDNFPGSYFSVP